MARHFRTDRHQAFDAKGNLVSDVEERVDVTAIANRDAIERKIDTIVSRLRAIEGADPSQVPASAAGIRQIARAVQDVAHALRLVIVYDVAPELLDADDGDGQDPVTR